MKNVHRMLCSALLALLASFALVSTASAAAPVATTTGAQKISSDGATLVGKVDPNGEATSYYFEYGATRRLGSRTPDGSAGSGTSARRVTTRLEGLAPDKRYFFRIVASNRSGVDSGETRSFRTRVQPLGLQISTAPNPVAFGAPTLVTGTLTGTDNAGKQVVLQQRAFPFTDGFAYVGNPVVTAADGTFRIPVLPLASTTQFRVQTVGERPVVTSPVITQAVAVRVRTRKVRRAVRRFKRVRIRGTVRPSRVGLPFEVQKRTKRGSWVIVRRGITRRSSDESYSRYSKRLRVPRTARYRVFVNAGNGDLVSGFGPVRRVRVKR